MKTRAILNAGLAALALTGTLAATTAFFTGVAAAGARDEAVVRRQAASSAAKARALLAKGRAFQAVMPAETAVTLLPREVDYRFLLGQVYLKSGRFTSAHAAFADTLALDPTNGKAALNLALVQIAEGQWDAARRTLDANAAAIPAADRGLAIALAGDPAGAVDVLISAARTPGADVKTRQNLALAMALAGRWQEAKTIAEADVGPAAIDQRIMEWAAFAKPKSASDQVASLLGVTPVSDTGQPVALALNAAPAMSPPIAVAAVVKPTTVAVAPVVSAPTPVVAVAAAPFVAPAPHGPAPAVAKAPITAVTFAAARAVVQPLPSAPVRTASPGVIVATGAFKTRLAAVPAKAWTPAKGDWFVQIGAFESAGVAKDAWSHATRRYAAFKGHVPAGMTFAAKGANFYRLSVGGFTRADAVATCRSYRAKGGVCFVRQGAGDQMAQWLKPNVQVASIKAKPVQLASR